MRSKEDWNDDLIQVFNLDSSLNYFGKIDKKKILRDISLYRDPNLGPQIQFGFVDQDVVIWDEEIETTGFEKVRNMFFHNIKPEDRKQIIIPKVIIELKYNGVTSQGLSIYSDYASSIKSIFPMCKYLLLVRYSNGSSANKLLRHGKFFDKIMILEEGSSSSKYVKGAFKNDLSKSLQLKKNFQEFTDYLIDALSLKESSFTK